MEASIDAPDDALLSAVLVKLFADRQLMPPPDLIPYLLKRMDRSFAAANHIVAQLDRESLARKRPITRALAALVLDKEYTSRAIVNIAPVVFPLHFYWISTFMSDPDFLTAPFDTPIELPELDLSGPGRFQNRELSWLGFNWRVAGRG